MKKSFEDLLECPVCFQTIDSAPIYQCLNGHVVCKDCHSKLDNCPICRDEKCYNPKLGFCREDKHFNLKVRNRKLEEIIKRYCIELIEFNLNFMFVINSVTGWQERSKASKVFEKRN